LLYFFNIFEKIKKIKKLLEFFLNFFLLNEFFLIQKKLGELVPHQDGGRVQHRQRRDEDLHLVQPGQQEDEQGNFQKKNPKNILK
jgi:hypothetical protein